MGRGRCIPFAGGFICGVKAKSCTAPNCRGDVVAECDWKLHRVEDGKRVYTGKTCNRGLCAKHRGAVGFHADGPHAGQEKNLCPAHLAEARRLGFVK